MEPVKCPDCSTWWRGDEHRCNAEKPEWVDAMLDAIRAMPHVCPQPYYVPWVPSVQPWQSPFIWSGTTTWTPPIDTNVTVYS